MGETLNVLVLGVGGNVSQGILKSLALSNLNLRVVGACIHPFSLGLFTTDRAYISPRASDPAFVDWLIHICRKERIRAVLSGVEQNLAMMSIHAKEILDGSGALCIVSPPEVLETGSDKLKTCQWLQKNGFNYPRYASVTDSEAVERLLKECGFPLIAKPRNGRSAIGLMEIKDESDLARAKQRPDYILEECLGTDESEYTVGAFTSRDGRLCGVIAMRRELREGTTYKAEIGEYPEVRAEASRIVATLKPMGPSNVQMRMSGDRAVCFEINLRFSGTAPIRARCGWNDVEASLRHYVLGEPAKEMPNVTQGIAIRYWNEMYIDPNAVKELKEIGSLGNPGEFNVRVENYGE
ncbi:MAG: ATP-grasp domain-containing protein [Planctomycetota bacterium]